MDFLPASTKEQKAIDKGPLLSTLPAKSFHRILTFIDKHSILTVRSLAKRYKHLVAIHECWCELVVSKFLPDLEADMENRDDDSTSTEYTNVLFYKKLSNVRNKGDALWFSYFKSAVILLSPGEDGQEDDELLQSMTQSLLTELKGRHQLHKRRACLPSN